MKLVELSLFRGGGRGEPLASLSVRSLFAEVCAFDGDTGTSTTHATIGALAIEDLRDPRARRRAVRGGYFPENVSTSPEESTSTSASESVSGTAVDRIPAPLLAYEQTKGPAVNGSRGSATLQRLRLEVEPTFLLDVARVFVPTLAGGGGEAPELVLPDDVRMTPGETYVLDRDVALNGRNRRILADGVEGGVYVLDGRGHAIAIDADGLVGGNGDGGGGGDGDEADFHPVIFVGPNCSLTIKNAVIETSSSRGGGTGAKKGPARGKALWPRLVRLAPGGRISASSRDKVSFASSHGAAVAPDKVTDTDKVTLVDGAKTSAVRGLKPGDRSSLSIRVVGVSLRLIGETRGDERDAIDLDFGLAASVHDEASDVAVKRKDEADDMGRLSDDDEEEGVVETDVQVQLLRVGVSRPEWDAGALRWIERAAGDDVLFPVDLTFRMISQANAATGARRRGVDARPSPRSPARSLSLIHI